MKSSDSELTKRGYISNQDVTPYLSMSQERLLNVLLKSPNPVQRSSAAAALRTSIFQKDKFYWYQLLLALQKEKALYTKIEICKNLELGNELAIEEMCQFLGKIGSNQHQYIPTTVSRKNTYPLPRDIIARTLGKIHPKYSKTLLNQFFILPENQLTEFIDAVGFFVYFNPQLATKENFLYIEHCYKQNFQNKLIVWKLTRCCSSFPIDEARNFLEKIRRENNHETILLEINRSLYFIDKKYN